MTNNTEAVNCFSETDYLNELRRPDGGRIAFIAESSLELVLDSVTLLYETKDTHGNSWYEVFHPSLPGVLPGRSITVVDRSLMPLAERPEFPKNAESTCLLTLD